MFIVNNTRGNSTLGCFVMGILTVIAVFLVLRGLYSLLIWAAPVLLVLALIIRWQVFPATFRNWMRTMHTNPISGLIQLAFAGLAFPFFALYMFLLALGGNKIEQLQNQFRPREPQAVPEEEFVDFEEIESKPKSDLQTEEPLKPPVVIREEPKKPENPYDQLFK